MKHNNFVLDKELVESEIENFYNSVSFLMNNLPNDIAVSDIENELGVAQGYIARTCNSKHTSKRMSIDNAISFANIFNISLDDLISGDFAIDAKIEELERKIEILKGKKLQLIDMKKDKEAIKDDI